MPAGYAAPSPRQPPGAPCLAPPGCPPANARRKALQNGQRTPPARTSACNMQNHPPCISPSVAPAPCPPTGVPPAAAGCPGTAALAVAQWRCALPPPRQHASRSAPSPPATCPGPPPVERWGNGRGRGCGGSDAGGECMSHRAAAGIFTVDLLLCKSAPQAHAHLHQEEGAVLLRVLLEIVQVAGDACNGERRGGSALR